MKKSLVVFALCCLLLVGVVSAFPFSDFWDKFTGKVVDNSIKPVCGWIGTRSEGWGRWDDSIIYDNCAGCEALCLYANTPKEGWYSSCNNKLIVLRDCDTEDSFSEIKKITLGRDYNLWEDNPEWYLQATVEVLNLSGKEGQILAVNTDTKDNVLEFEIYKGAIDSFSSEMWYSQEGISFMYRSPKTSDPSLDFRIFSGGLYSILYISRPEADDVPENLEMKRVVSFENPDTFQTFSKDLKALAVIVDFQDKKLEDYSGEGATSVSDVQDILDKMEKHWTWMSVGSENVSWDLIRITLPEDFSPDAYSSGYDFRDEIVDLAKAQVDDSLYDFDGDGNIDNIFAIISSDDKAASDSDYDYITAGAAYKNRDVRIFMDPQGSQSVLREVYGNFNHEFGHGHTVRYNWGLPDMYGPYDTLGYLSLMADSWTLPGNGFCAYERYLLGWLVPEAISSDVEDVFLLPAEENLEAVRINTDDPLEFFLVEYKKKPQEGFGSASFISDHNGLAIYHLYEHALGVYANADLPPLIYFESADGEIPYVSGGPEETDYWYPDNLESSGVFYAKKWNSDEVVFRIENLRFEEEGMLFDVFFNDEITQEDEEISIQEENCTDACLLDGKCYSFGYRKSGEFCSEEKEIFIEQSLAGEICKNNFECESNVCINKKCVSGNLIQKIINWFKKFSGLK